MSIVTNFSSQIIGEEWTTYCFESVAKMFEPKYVNTVAPTNLIEQWWLGLVTHYTEFGLIRAFFIFMDLCYLSIALFFYMCDRFHFLKKYKVQQEKYSTNLDYMQCLWNLVQNYVIVIFPLTYIAYPLFNALEFKSVLPLPNLVTFCWQFYFCMLFEDFTHYWLHRFLHTPWMYKHIHKIHHTYSAPFGLTAAYAHPIEVLILGVATFSGPMIIRPHYFTFYCWVLFRQLDAVATHCGYDIPHPFGFLPFHGGTPAHDMHHKTFIFNYSSRFTHWDRLCGTFKDPEKSK